MILSLQPNFVEKIWGGKKLKEMRNLESNSLVGETWEVSTMKQGPCYANGKFLNELSKSQIAESGHLPYLIKYINTSDNLSIQVHPDDEKAKISGLENGKSEAWLVLDCEKGAGVYLGIKKGVSEDQFFDALKDNKIIDCLNFIEVSPGDLITLPSGAVHAIGKDITLLEVQQSSDITYRVWDWDRKDSEGNSRTLHIEQAKKCIDFHDKFNQSLLDMIKTNTLVGDHNIPIHSSFHCQLVELQEGESIQLRKKQQDYASSITAIRGIVEIQAENETMSLRDYNSVLITRDDQREFLITAKQTANILFVD